MIYIFSVDKERKALVFTSSIIDFNDPAIYECTFIKSIDPNNPARHYKVSESFRCHSRWLSIPTEEELSHLSKEDLLYGI